MDAAIFRKGDAPSVLVVDKSWNDIIDKPDFFDELAERIVMMEDAATEIGLMQKSTPFGGLAPNMQEELLKTSLKGAINEILMKPLTAQLEYHLDNREKAENSILADAFWDEIIINKNIWERLYQALDRAYKMKERIDDNSPLSNASTIQNTKSLLNEAVIEPLLGINRDD